MGDRITVQQVLHLTTTRDSLRAEVVGWGGEDPRLYIAGRHIGHTPGPQFPAYGTVLAALADGWRLLCDCNREDWTNDDGKGGTWWCWTLVREVPRGG